MAGKAQPGRTPSKKCPECGAEVHTRRKQCDCGYIFVSKSQQAAQASGSKPGPKPRAAAAVSLKEQLKQERAKLQKRLQAIETLLEPE